MSLRPESLRTRLTLWYSGALTLILLAFGLSLYVIVRVQLLRHHDTELTGTARDVERVLSQRADCEHLSPEQVKELNGYSKLVLFHSVDGGTRSFYRSPDLEFPSFRELTATPGFLNERATFKTYEEGHGYLRVYTRPYRSHAGRQGLIRVLERIGDVDLTLANLRLALFVLAPLAVAASSLGGYWLAGRALAPVDEITSLAREIEASQLSRRLPIPPVHDEIGRLVETFNQMIARLEASFEGMKRFTADASHELRSPLANLKGTVEVALSHPRDASEYQTALRSVGEDVERLRRIVEDLLVLARADARRLALDREPVKVGVLARDIVDSLTDRASAAGVRLCARADTPGTVLGDERWLRQLVFNLLENGLKFTMAAPQPGCAPEVSVVVVADGDCVRMSVIDSGPGIPEADLEHVFERFYRADWARAQGPAGGFGLGLSIAAWIVEAHGGTIRALRRAEGGTEMLVRLPLDPRLRAA
ncbi:MAG: HAMP domain-containing protein [Acidobacteria bacterium]|nr:HAMP domain-containing protein [Acidobacteriota bacterium]